MYLSLTFNDNGRAHDDLELRFAGQQWICDSYYYALDDEVLPGVENQAKVRAVMRRLLEQWQDATRNLMAGEVAFLPYAFFDLSTGWLHCTRTEKGFVIVHGWSDVEGWSILPSTIGPMMRGLGDFRADGATLEIGTRELADAISASLSMLA